MATLRSPGLKVKLLVGYMQNPTKLKGAVWESGDHRSDMPWDGFLKSPAQHTSLCQPSTNLTPKFDPDVQKLVSKAIPTRFQPTLRLLGMSGFGCQVNGVIRRVWCFHRMGRWILRARVPIIQSKKCYHECCWLDPTIHDSCKEKISKYSNFKVVKIGANPGRNAVADTEE